ncbi:MAG TPA: family 31 glucosidase [Candidatus Caccovicinus merdipullorum]|uniref:Family 31 glucosidase n=1 Tax=Candidatus Caccovicinus merdipullorum TaxID=2840724 RepID=A0A9D1KGI6_9FIRM|nr:family 31 glucosidase [Candidatus Caccovicinus merdipullorum]
MEFFKEKDGALIFRRRREFMEIRPWGSGFRIRSTENKWFTQRDWALLQIPTPNASIQITPEGASITSADSSLTIKITPYGKVSFFDRQGRLLLKEYYRSWNYGTKNWKDLDQITMCRMAARTYKSAGGDNYSLSLCFESDDNEKIYGMGQYQQPYLNLKGCCLELAQKNTQASVPFMVSSKGYGLLWNNPAVGQAVFGMNLTEFSSQSAKEIDYWITAGDTPTEIVERYSDVTGKVPMIPEFALGFWQCKLRYETQEEVLQIAREYFLRQIPLSVIVIDFFHWPNQGDWTFDPKYFPDPEAMIKELDSMGIKLMVSIWPTVDRHSVHYQEMKERDLLIRTNRGIDAAMEFYGMESFTDVTNPEARDFIWQAARKNYLDKGVALFWLDEAEPEYTVPDFDNYRYYDGQALECANEYPACYARAFYEGMKEAGIENPINLIRCAWAGSQRFGALVWSGDVPSTFTYLRNQFAAGLNMGMAGIPWWTADIGGFHGGNIHDPAFHELLMRWFQFGTFCPVMRLHGDRDPHKPAIPGTPASGAGNEVWSYPPHVQEMMIRFIHLRQAMKDYLSQAMREAHEKGTPVMKPLFYDFPEDPLAWEAEDVYLFGHDLLVAPVLDAGIRRREVYLPVGAQWTEMATGKIYSGGQRLEVSAPLEEIPLFLKNGAHVFSSSEI